MINISKRTVYEIIFVTWVILAVCYLIHTPFEHRNHDLNGHLVYTNIILNEHRLPLPNEGWETFQPPLYYLINSLVNNPQSHLEFTNHIQYVRYLSVLYGGITLLIITWFLQKLNFGSLTQLLILFFLASTPKFVFVFSTYNNDSLGTLLSIAILTLSYSLFMKWTNLKALLLLILSISGAYTKYSVLLTIFFVIICSIGFYIKTRQKRNFCFGISRILLVGILSLSPWVILHNYPNGGKLFPNNFKEYEICQDFQFKDFKNLFGILLKIPEWQINHVDYSKEWEIPWVYPSWHFICEPTKRYDYWAFSFITSIIGEYAFHKPDVIFIWILLYIYLLVYLLGLMSMVKSGSAKLAALLILFTHVSQIVSIPVFPYQPHRNMDYRYICWNWIGWAVLYGNTLSSDKLYSFILRGLLFIGILLQVYILMTVEGGFWV